MDKQFYALGAEVTHGLTVQQPRLNCGLLGRPMTGLKTAHVALALGAVEHAHHVESMCTAVQLRGRRRLTGRGGYVGVVEKDQWGRRIS
jgi:hypothetical protein